MLEEGCPEDFIKGLLPSVSSRFPVERLVEECVKRYASFRSALHLHITILFSHFTFYVQESSLFSYLLRLLEQISETHCFFYRGKETDQGDRKEDFP